MKVLGVSYGYHDSSACLVVDGKVVAAAAEERFTRQKHDSNFPTYAIEFVLARGKIKPSDLDQVVFHEDPHAKFSRVVTSALAPFPASRKEFVNALKAWLGRKLWSINTISSRLDVGPDKISYLSHHFSHAVQAFMGSGFEESAIMIVDAVGDWACTALYKGKWEDGKPKVERVMEMAFPNSLGLVYSAFTAYLGFSPNDSECSTMALSAFGKPSYADKLREIIAAKDDGTYEVDQKYFNFSTFYKGAVTERFLDAFGQPRSFKNKLPQTCFSDKIEVPKDPQRWADAACSVQLVLEERILALLERLHQEVPSDNLCYAGGVSLNCVANTKLLQKGPFKNWFIPPDPGDGGTSVGTALYYAAVNGDCTPEGAKYGPYVGSDFDEADDIKMIDHINPDHVLRYLKRGLEQTPGVRWKHETFDDPQALCDHVAKRLMDRQIVGWCQGRAELGPRALGNRSILIRPDDIDLALRLSRKVKDRALYRPYAFSICSDDAARALAIKPEHFPFNRWMQFAVPVKKEVEEKVVSALHVDRSTRVQICYPEDNPIYNRLLTTFGKSAGLGALLNTSFNASGYPIVSTAVEAMVMFARTDMDALVLNNTVVWKQ
ncbi:MAG: carbamoyltransferase N-terminal domain-containing protein [Byssovorax sp.]